MIAVSRRRMDPALAERLGVEVLTYEDQVPGGADVVIEATGKQWPLDLAAELTRERGRLIVAGYHQDGPRQVNMQLWNWRGLDVINAHERDPAVYRAASARRCEAVAAGRLDLGRSIPTSFRWTAERGLLDATRDRPDGFLKALVTGVRLAVRRPRLDRPAIAGG